MSPKEEFPIPLMWRYFDASHRSHDDQSDMNDQESVRLMKLEKEQARFQSAILNISIMLRACLTVLGNDNLYDLHARELVWAYFGEYDTVRSAVVTKLKILLKYAAPENFEVDGTRSPWDALKQLPINTWTHGKPIKIHLSSSPIGGVEITAHEDPLYGMADGDRIFIAVDEEPFAHRIWCLYNWMTPCNDMSIDDLVDCIELVLIHEMAHVILKAKDVLLPEEDPWDGERCYGVVKCLFLAETLKIRHLAVENADNIAMFVILLYISIRDGHWDLTDYAVKWLSPESRVDRTELECAFDPPSPSLLLFAGLNYEEAWKKYYNPPTGPPGTVDAKITEERGTAEESSNNQ